MISYTIEDFIASLQGDEMPATIKAQTKSERSEDVELLWQTCRGLGAADSATVLMVAESLNVRDFPASVQDPAA